MAKHVEYEKVGSDYLEHRQLKRGAAGWVLLAGLGVLLSTTASALSLYIPPNV